MKTCRGRAQSALTHHDHGGTVDCHRKSDNSHSHPEPAKPTVKTCSGRGQPSHTHHDHGGTVDCHRKSDAPAGHGHAPITASDPVGDALKRAGSLIATGTKAALKAAVEALRNEAADQLESIDWDRFETDPVEASKLLELLNPVLEQSNLDVRVYTLNDLQTLWSDIGEQGRAAAATGAGGAACYVAVEAILVKVTKGKSLKPGNRHAVGLFLGAACAIGAEQVPVPDPDGDGSSDDGSSDDDASDDDSSDDGDGDGDDSSETQPTCQPWPNCRTAKPRDGGGSSTPQTPAPTTTQPPAPATTQPPFDHTDCHTWLEAIRACIKIDERDGRATITYH
ncbi:hypothetical protein [Candidatus Poriferisodalis sp.]|uniref:hypothetical protein n=1 Tax=Candidatus Poriferisodalis sp. TaxID=3101277 RepID=UPI003B027DA4